MSFIVDAIELEQIKLDLNCDCELNPTVKPCVILKINSIISQTKQNIDVSKFDKRVKVYYKAIVKNKIDLVFKSYTTEMNEFGIVSFNIPYNTIGIKITVHLNDIRRNLVRSSLYYPGNCKTDIESSDCKLRLTVKVCNQLSIDTAGLDHAPVTIGEQRVFGHQLGPHRSSRAMAIIHLAMFEAYNSIVKKCNSYINLTQAHPNTSTIAAIASACYETLIALYPSHQPRLVDIYNDILAQIPTNQGKSNGITVGQNAATQVLQLRENDGSDHNEQTIAEYMPGNEPGVWRPDPISQNDTVLGSLWPTVSTFVLPNAEYYRVDPPPSLTSPEYTVAYEEVKSMGGDGINTVTVRTEENTHTGIFWAYDGTPSLCAPPRLYNQMVTQIFDDQNIDDDLLRILTIINIALADACIACWDSKYYHKFWRPVTAIRESDVGTGPTGLGDGNPNTVGDVNFTPLNSPASNLSNGVNFTPPFPTYPSGHGCFGGALFQILRRYFGTDDIKFTFVSDEYNGKTKDNEGNVRPYKPKTFNNFSTAEEENAQSRVYLGIHYSFDKTSAVELGNNVGNYVYDNLFIKQN